VTSAIQTQLNGKQAGPLTGDVTTSGAAATLATVNSNVGSFGSSTAIPAVTVNGKGLITAISTSAVIAPAGTLTGTTLAANVVTSSLTAVGTIGTGVWQGTKVAEIYGGTNQSTYTLGDILYASAANTLSKLAGSTTSTIKVLAQTGTGTVSAAPAWNAATGTGNVVFSASPTLSGTITFPGSTQIDSSGNLGVGTAPSFTVDILKSQNSSTIVNLTNPNSGASATARFRVAGEASSGLFEATSIAAGDIVNLKAGGDASGGLLLQADAAAPVAIGTNSTVRLTIDSNGNVISSVGAIATQGYDTSTATSGTITASANKPGLVINSAGGTTLTIKLPSSPIDGQQYFVASVGAFTTVTWQDSGGTAGNVIGGQILLGGTNRGQRFVYSAALTKWLSI
jgi:hypothetical protein